MWMFLLSAGAAFVLVGLMLLITRRTGLVDMPGSRSSHSKPIPTGAGVALIAALWLASGLYPLFADAIQTGTDMFPGWIPLLLMPASLLCFVGFLDDRRSLAAGTRLLVQLIAALMFMFGIRGALGEMVWLVAPGLVFLIWSMNAYNFMDGSHGMAGMQGLIGGVSLAGCLLLADAPGLSLAAASLAGVCAGFVPWNAPRARIFMGDSGSVALGFLFAGLGLYAYVGGLLSLPVVLLLQIIFHLDAGLTLLSRIRNKERWYTAHRRHVYQRLLVNGWTHGQVLSLYTALNALLVAPAMVVATLQGQWSWAIFGFVTGILSLAWYTVSLKLGKGS